MKALIVAIVVVSLGGAVHAESNLDRARTLNALGMKKYRLGEYDAALQLFQRAYDTVPQPKILFNIAQAYRKKGDAEHALASYRAYLVALPDASNRAEVESVIRDLEAVVAPGRKAEPAQPGPVPLPVPTVPPAAAPAPAAVAPERGQVFPRRRWYQDKLGWTLAGSGLVIAAAGAGLYLHAQAQKDDLPATPEGDRADLRDAIGRNQTLGGAALIVGGALLAGGVVRFVLTERAARGTEMTVAIGPSWIWLGGRF